MGAGAIANADLSFRTRQAAEQAPEVLQATMRQEIAIGVLMSAESLDSEAARELLHQEAQRAGVPPDQLAETLLEVYRNRNA